jgi:carbon storage regulator
MLILSRRTGESLTIGDDIVITVVAINGNQIRLGIAAPRDVRVLREEIYRALQEENRAAATAASRSRENLERALKQVQGTAKEDKRE